MTYIKSLILLTALLIAACGGGGGESGKIAPAPVTYTVSTSVSVGGSIQPTSVTVTSGNTTALSLTLDEGYRVAEATGCNGTLSGMTYTTGIIQSNCTVTVRFEKIVYTVSFRTERNNTLSDQEFKVQHGDSLSFPVPELTWYQSSLSGTCNGRIENGTYVIDSVKSACNVNQRYDLVYAPAGIVPAMGFNRNEYRVLSGETRAIALLGETFSRGNVIYTVEQTSGPSISAVLKGNVLEVTAPPVAETTITTFNVQVISSAGTTKSQQLSVIVHPAESTEVKRLYGDSEGLGIDLVITGDGFTAAEQDKLSAEASRFLTTFFAEPTIATHREFWNIHHVPAVSQESGAINGQEGHATRNTAFGSFFNCQGTERLLCTNVSTLLSYVTERVPQYDQVMLIVNDEKYGGAGYWGAGVATYSLSPSAVQMAIHEIGHSFATLADEYEYGSCSNSTEPTQANVTIESNAANTKWNHWYADPNNIPTNASQPADAAIGHFEGGRYCSFGVWRATFNSKMRNLGMPFGAVNAEQWALSVYRDAGVTRGHFPARDEVLLTANQGSVYSVDTYADGSVQKVQWFFNGVLLDERLSNGKTLFVPPQDNDFTIKAVVSDVSGLIRKDPEQLSSKTYEWRGRITAQGE